MQAWDKLFILGWKKMDPLVAKINIVEQKKSAVCFSLAEKLDYEVKKKAKRTGRQFWHEVGTSQLGFKQTSNKFAGISK